MKKNFNISTLLILAVYFLLSGCSNDNGTEITETIKPELELYYSYQDTTQHLISDMDTISIGLTDTFSLSIKMKNITEGNLVLAGKDNFETLKTGDYNYQLIAQNAGFFDIGAFAYDEETGKDVITFFNVNVPSLSYLIFTVEDPIYTIDVENSSLKNTIQSELDARDIPSLLFLSFTTVTGGTLKLGLSEDTVTGTFNTPGIDDFSEINAHYTNASHSFRLEEATSSSDYPYLLIQYFTEEFRTKYPSEIIYEVSASSKALKERTY